MIAIVAFYYSHSLGPRGSPNQSFNLKITLVHHKNFDSTANSFYERKTH